MSEIDDKYNQLGGSSGFLGQPTSPEQATPNGLGRYRHYQGGSIYWSHARAWEAYEVHGLIRTKWGNLGWESSPLGFPISDEGAAGAQGSGRISVFEYGVILYRPDIGAFEIHGAINRRWQVAGMTVLGFPLTDELSTPDVGHRGRYNHFERGSIYWSPQTGAQEILPDIKDVWAAQGWEQGPLGYPIAEQARMPGSLTDFQDFEHGTIYAFGPNAKTLRTRNFAFATNERFIAWNSFGSALPDGDILISSFSHNFPQFGIRLTLNLGPGVTWWKAVSLFTPGRGDFQEIAVEGSKTSATMVIHPNTFDSDPVLLHFKKAKTFGIHTGMYFLGRADRLIGTHLTITWIRDH